MRQKLYYICMHMYQKHILDLLRQAESMRYVQLQPDGVESSHFKYHLNQLITDKLVAQKSRGVYMLSEKGKQYVDSLSDQTLIPHATPKVITYCLLQDSAHYFLYRKTKEPYRGLYNLVGGKLHIGETSKQAVIRELKEKINLEGVESKLLANAEILIRSHNNPFTHVVAYIYTVEITMDQSQQLGLMEYAKAKIQSAQDLAPDVLPILSALDSGAKNFVVELNM